MASAPRFKIYNRTGRYITACKYAADAAAIVSLHCDGATVRDNHRKIIWREGKEEIPAGESYDRAAEIMLERLAEDHPGG